MIYHLTLESANGSVRRLFGVQLDTRAPAPWLVAAALMLVVVARLYRKLQPRLLARMERRECGHRGQAEAEARHERALELKDVRKSFGKSEIIRGVDLAIGQGERHAIIGPNGAGKSTLFNLYRAAFASARGEILLNGENITGLRPYEINRQGLSRSFQITNIFHKLSVYENLRCAVLWSLGYSYSFWHRLGGLRDAHGAPRRCSRRSACSASATCRPAC